MKTARRCARLVAGLAFATLATCSPADSADPNASRNTFSATIDGVSWTASACCIATFVSGNNVHITGASGVGTPGSQTVSIWVNRTVLGRQALTLPNQTASVGVGLTTWSTFTGGEGTISVETLDATHMTGTFEFTVTRAGATPETRRVTAGRFDVTFDANR